MQGVVPAAGKGTRLRPQTAERPKALVPVAGRPLLAYSLETLVELGVDELLVVVGYRGGQIEAAFGATFGGTPIRYATQGEPIGLADAILTVEDVVDGDFVVLNGDNIVETDLGPVLDRHRTAEAAATLVVDEVTRDRAAEGGVVTFDVDGRPIGVVEKPADPPSTWVTRGCYVFSPTVFDACRQVARSATGEYELSAAVDHLIEIGAKVTTVSVPGRWLNINTPADVAAAEQVLEQ